MTMFQTAVGMCQIALAAHKSASDKPLTREDIVRHVDQVLSIAMFADNVDRTTLIAALEQNFTIWSDDPSAIGNDDDHVPWLAARRGDISWRFWDRYCLYLIDALGLAPAALETI